MSNTLPTIEGISPDDLREAVAAAKDATGGGQLNVTGAKGGTRAMLGRALLAAIEEIDRANKRTSDLVSMAGSITRR